MKVKVIMLLAQGTINVNQTFSLFTKNCSQQIRETDFTSLRLNDLSL